MINILAMVGIVTDPTTQGVSDSNRALTYDKPAKNSTTNDYDFD